jgi:hypothetical protein
MLKIKSNKFPIYNYTIYAERHCGTNFLEKYLPKIYSGSTPGIDKLPLTWQYGWKHWFGLNNKKIIEKSQNTLFIGIVRDPYDWLMALKHNPYHLRSWNGNTKNNPFKNDNDFLTSEVISCHKNGEELTSSSRYGSDHHIYENRRYKNIFELREVKNKYLLEIMPEISYNYVLINYEIFNTNIKLFIDALNDNFNLKSIQFIENNYTKKRYDVDSKILPLINDSLNWNTEKILGYHQRWIA